MLGAFEDHVLDEMRNAIPFLVFIPRSRLDPNADTDRTNVIHLLSDDAESVGQHLSPNIAILVHSFYSHTPAAETGNQLYVYESKQLQLLFACSEPIFFYNQPMGLRSELVGGF